ADGNMRLKRSGSSYNSFRVAGDRDDNRPGHVPGSFPGTSPRSFPQEGLGQVPGTTPRSCPENSPGKYEQRSQARPGHQVLASFLAAPTLIVAGPILMRASPPRPLTDQRSRGGGRPDEAGQQMTDFSCRQGNGCLSRQG